MYRTLMFVMLVACGGDDAAPAKAVASAPKAAAVSAPKVEAKAEAPAAAPASAAAGDADVANGEKIYNQYCKACHQADGTGMGGMLAGDFVNDPSRLAKSDEELLRSIDQGVNGSIGAMPPWKGTVSPEGQRDVLAYIRESFGE